MSADHDTAMARGRVEAVAALYARLSPDDLPRLGQWYADDVRFVDPFNDLLGIAALRRVFEHMFATLDEPKFVVLEIVAEGDRAWLTWDFHFRRRGRRQAWRIHGATRLRFAADGRVAEHIDYWDAAAGLYEKLPLLGAVLRALKRRLAA